MMKNSLGKYKLGLLVGLLMFVWGVQADNPKADDLAIVSNAAKQSSLDDMKQRTALLVSNQNQQTGFNDFIGAVPVSDISSRSDGNFERPVGTSSDSAMLLCGLAMLAFIVGRRSRVF